MNEDKVKKTNKHDLIFFNEALEYLDDSNHNKLPIYPNPSPTRSNVLRDEMLEELNHLKELIINNPDLKLESLNKVEKKLFFKFIDYYSICPICRKTNHYSNLKKFYFNEELEEIREILIRIMSYNDSKLNKLNLNFGIPCCNCYKKFFKEI